MAKQELDFPDPNLLGQLDATIAAVEDGGSTVDWLREHQFPREAAAHALKTLAEARDRLYTLSRTVGLSAIAEGDLSQAQVAELIGVHPQTVGHWVADARANPEPDRDYANDYFSATKKPRRPASA